MRLNIVLCVLGALALAACESTPESTGATSGTGASTPSTGGPGGPGGVGTGPGMAGAVRPGSEEEFVRIGDRVFFAFDRYDLTPESREILEKQSQWLKRYSNFPVQVAGHADERGTREYNLALGERRANSVRDYLVALGIPTTRIKTISYGKERPVDPRSNEDAWAKNRRAVTQINAGTGRLTN
jgi:peptidoglycan-associated lipoprotein